MKKKTAFKYTLIISQFYHSRHFFIVKHDNDFLKNARDFARELIEYKRKGSEFYKDNPEYLGDLDPKYCGDGKRPRYNLNDRGDIYFIQAEKADDLIYQIIEYRNKTVMESKGRIKKSISDLITTNHRYSEIRPIVEKHFKMA